MPTLGEQQLAKWQDIARTWPVSFDRQQGHPWQPDDPHRDNSDRAYRCAECGKGIALALDLAGHRYQYSDEQWLALVVLHLRSHHADLDPDR